MMVDVSVKDMVTFLVNAKDHIQDTIVKVGSKRKLYQDFSSS